MMAALPEERYNVRDIFIDKQGSWHVRGVPTTPARALAQIDVVLSGLHGQAGDDGTLGRLIERAGIRYAGSSPMASALAFNKIRSREALLGAGLSMPRAVSFLRSAPFSAREMSQYVFRQFGPPYIVKPPAESASRGIRIADHFAALPETLADTLGGYGAAVVEEFIRGREATVGIIRGFRGETLYALPPVRVALPDGSRHIVHAHHLAGALRPIVPSDFSGDEKSRLAAAARAAHEVLGLGHFSRADFMVTPKRIFLLEVDPTPRLYPESPFVAALNAVGSSVREFLEHAIGLARA